MISGNAGVILPHCTCFRPALQGGFPKRKPVSAVHVRRPIISQNPFDNWHKGRYNKNTERCLLVTDIPLLWDLNGCHDTYNYCESNDPMSRLLVADGSLLSVMELIPRLIKHPGNGTETPTLSHHPRSLHPEETIHTPQGDGNPVIPPAMYIVIETTHTPQGDGKSFVFTLQKLLEKPFTSPTGDN